MKISYHSASELTSECIQRWAELQRTNADTDTPFFRPEFTTLCAKVRPDIEVAKWSEGGELVGFFAYQRQKGNIGWPVGGSLADMQGFIVQPGKHICIGELTRATGLQTLHYDHVVASQAGFSPFHKVVDDAPFIDLKDGYQAYRDERRKAGSSLIGQAERKRRKLEREVGPVRFEYHTTDPQVLEMLIAWKRRQLQQSNYSDVLQEQWLRELFRLTCLEDSVEYCGRLSALYAGGNLIAIHLGLQSYDVHSSWMPTYNPEYSKYSPGLILHTDLAREAATQGVTRVDLGRGQNALKTSLMSNSIPLAIGTVEHRPLQKLRSAAWYFARHIVYSTGLRGKPLRWFRQIRNSLHNKTT